MNAQDLKNSILQLAIQGKLVEQREEEGTAKELLKQIKLEKERLIKEKKIKKEQLLKEVTENEVPFDIPESWEWVRFGNVMINRDSERIPLSVSQRDSLEKIYDYYGASGVIDKVNNYIFDKKLLLIGEDGANLLTRSKPIAFLAVGKYWVNNHAHVIDCGDYIYLEYVMYYINAISLAKYVTGTAQPKMNQAKLNSIPVALPPLEEQKRIVAKIEDLLPYIEKYGEAHSKLEVFNKKFPEDMQKSILQYAIQGKLVEQRDEEGTAETLYQQIQEEKVKLIKEGKIKKEKPLPAITEDEIPYEIPESWKWVRLQEIGELSRGKSKHRPRNDVKIFENGTFPLIQTGDVARADEIITQYTTMYNELGVAQSRVWEKGTVCLTIAANIGDVAILGFDACFPDSVVGFNAYHPIDTNMFFLYVLMCYKDILDKMSRSTAQKNINIDILSKVAFPLPPLAEQKRIVEKIKEMMPYCKQVNK